MMRVRDRRLHPAAWATAHPVDLGFGLLAAGWVLYVLRISSDFYFFGDDLRLVDQAGSLGGMFDAYNGHLSLVILSIYRASAELGDLSFRPFMLAGSLSLVAVPVTYFVTTRRQLGAPLAAVLAMPLLWYDGTDLRPAMLNHLLALVGAIVCAAALNRGRRADGFLAAGLTLSLSSAGGGVVVAGACLLHNALVRPPRRRWLAVLVPSLLWAGWWFLLADTSPSSPFTLTAPQAGRIVRDLCLSPFYAAGFGNRFLAYLLMAGFLVHGAAQLRGGLRSGANFLTWSAAMVAWAIALVESRGALVDPHIFRYAYVSLGFALLAVVPHHAIRWPEPLTLTNRRWLAAAAVIVVAFGGFSGLAARSSLQEDARKNSELGREAEGTMLVLGLGPAVIPDSTPLNFFGFGVFIPQGSAGRVRAFIERYGSPFDATTATADRELVDRGIVRVRAVGSRGQPGCSPLTEPVSEPGIAAYVVTRGVGAKRNGEDAGPSPQPLELWSRAAYAVDVRRYGDEWVRLADVPAGRTVVLTLPALNTARPWEIRANGACDVRPATTGT